MAWRSKRADLPEETILRCHPHWWPAARPLLGAIAMATIVKLADGTAPAALAVLAGALGGWGVMELIRLQFSSIELTDRRIVYKEMGKPPVIVPIEMAISTIIWSDGGRNLLGYGDCWIWGKRHNRSQPPLLRLRYMPQPYVFLGKLNHAYAVWVFGEDSLTLPAPATPPPPLP